MYDKLIYGKNQIERIVSVEHHDGYLELFIENPDGTIESKFEPSKYWILANKPITSSFIKLKGNLYYKYGIQFEEREAFQKARYFWRSNDIFSIYDPKESGMINKGITYFKGMKHDEVSCLAFDIEATSLEHTEDAKVLLISNTFKKHGNIEHKLFSYDEYENEGAMLDDWCKWVREKNPSIILGHNIFTYDLPYMEFIANKYGTTLTLGRDGSGIKFDEYESKFRKDATQFYHYHKAKIYGRELIDTLFLSIKYDVSRKYESYGLKSIIAFENLEVKDRTFYDASQIRFKYKDVQEWKKIKQYAIHDADDALALYNLMSPPFFYMTQSIPKSYQLVIESATGSPVNAIMMRSYLQEGHSLPKASESIDYEGAISFGNPGIYRNVFKIDVASLYPSIMIQYEVYDKDKDPNGYFLNLVKTFTNRRLEHKKLAKKDKYYDDLQNAEKIFINSAYGFLGTNGLLFNSPSLAAFITRKGREILQQSIDWAEKKEMSIVNADTDSISFCRRDGREITAEDKPLLLKEVNSLFPERIRFEDDGYYPTVIVVKAKNYALWDGKKLKIKGSALKATTKEPALKEFIQRIINTIIEDKKQFQDIYKDYVKEIVNVKEIKRWATRKTITNKVLNAERTNEQKVKDAIENSEYAEGDRAYFFFDQDNSLKLIEHFNGSYNKDKLLEKLYKTAEIFDTILDMNQFPNYKLKKNKEFLEKIA